MPRKRLKSRAHPPRSGTAEPVAEEPAPRAVTEILYLCASAKTLPTYSLDRTCTTASGMNESRKLSRDAPKRTPLSTETRPGNFLRRARSAAVEAVEFFDAICLIKGKKYKQASTGTKLAI